MAPGARGRGVRRSRVQRDAALRRGEALLRDRMLAVANRETEVGTWAAAAPLRAEGLRLDAVAKSELDQQNSELRQANEHLVIATLEAQELREAALVAQQHQEEFLAMLAHELRNPLGPLRNSFEILTRLPPTQPAPQNVLAVIGRQVEHLTRLVDDLLDVSRVTQGKVVLQRQLTEVSAFIRHAIEIASESIAGRHQHLHVAVPDDPLYVNGDLVRLGQVFANLLQNASKYTPDGGVIRLQATVERGSVVVRVADNGEGITAIALPRVFDLFAQDARTMARSHGGLGIGLTVVRRMVELHGGTVVAHSAGPGQGSEFTVILPRADGPIVAVAAPTAVVTASASPSKRVLLIEDNVDAGDMLAMLLRSTGYVVEVARDGKSGLEHFDRFKPNVVICDIGLPDMNGYELAVRLRQRPLSGPVTMIALTGYGDARAYERSMAAGFTHHLVKPAEPAEVLRLIDSVSAPLIARDQGRLA